MNSLVMLLQCDLGSAGEVAAGLRTCHLHLAVVDADVGLDVRHGLAAVVAELAAVRLLRGVPVLDVAGEGGGGGAGHVAQRALVVVHVAPHVVPQVPLNGELLVAGGADVGVARLLLEAVGHELDSVGEQSTARGAAHQPLLAVAPDVLLQFGH